MRAKPRILDLYCGEGGAGEGYRRAGFHVVGVDLNDDCRNRYSRPRPKPLKRYPFFAIEADALLVLERLLEGKLSRFDAIHASPPCQLFSSISRLSGKQDHHIELIGPTRELLRRTGLPYVIENVERAPLVEPIRLCGSMFDPPLDVQRHRLFESNQPLEAPHPTCRHNLWTPRFRSADHRGRRSGKLSKVVPVYGGTCYPGDVDLRRKVMEMPWATNQGVTQAIPPRYSQWIGKQLRAAL